MPPIGAAASADDDERQQRQDLPLRFSARRRGVLELGWRRMAHGNERSLDMRERFVLSGFDVAGRVGTQIVRICVGHDRAPIGSRSEMPRRIATALCDRPPFSSSCLSIVRRAPALLDIDQSTARPGPPVATRRGRRPRPVQHWRIDNQMLRTLVNKRMSASSWAFSGARSGSTAR